MKNYLPDYIWEACLKKGSLKELDRYLSDNVTEFDMNDLEYPSFHRICDVKIKDQTYRLLREIEGNTEKLSIAKCDEQIVSEQLGVPYPLKGDNLRKWIQDEENEDIDTDCPTRWSKYINVEILKKYINEINLIVYKETKKTDFIVGKDGTIKSTTNK